MTDAEQKSVPKLMQHIDVLANQADQLDSEVGHLQKEMEKGEPLDPPGWYDDCLTDLVDAQELAAKLTSKLTAAWFEAKKGVWS